MTKDATFWTLAYRKPRANRFKRVTDLATDWHGAMAAAELFTGKGIEVWVTTNAAAEAAGYTCAEDVGNILSNNGTRVRVVDTGTLADLERLTILS